MYSTTELANLTGYTNSTISNILRKHKIKEVETGFKGVKYWDESCLEIIKNEQNKQIKETITIGTLCSMFNIPLSEIRGILFDKGISPVTINHNPFYHNNYQEVYPIEAKEILSKHLDNVNADDCLEHPLVTDKRWLKTNNWPDTTPKCFEDLNEDIA